MAKKPVKNNTTETTVEIKTPKSKVYTKAILFYAGIIIATLLIWGIIFGGLASMTSPVLTMSLFLQTLALFIGFGTVVLLRDIIRHHHGKD